MCVCFVYICALCTCVLCCVANSSLASLDSSQQKLASQHRILTKCKSELSCCQHQLTHTHTLINQQRTLIQWYQTQHKHHPRLDTSLIATSDMATSPSLTTIDMATSSSSSSSSSSPNTTTREDWYSLVVQHFQSLLDTMQHMLDRKVCAWVWCGVCVVCVCAVLCCV